MSNLTCPHCQMVIKIDYRCSNCRNILPIILSNPFILLDIEPKFDLSRDDIKIALINKLTFYHPDKFINATSKSKEIATQNAALLNQAAKILMDDVKRAEVLILMREPALIKHLKEIVDQEIFIASLELQEEIDAADVQEECEKILFNIKKKLTDNYQKLVRAFNQNSLKEAQKLCMERNFLIRSKINIENKLQYN